MSCFDFLLSFKYVRREHLFSSRWRWDGKPVQLNQRSIRLGFNLWGKSCNVHAHVRFLSHTIVKLVDLFSRYSKSRNQWLSSILSMVRNRRVWSHAYLDPRLPLVDHDFFWYFDRNQPKPKEGLDNAYLMCNFERKTGTTFFRATMPPPIRAINQINLPTASLPSLWSADGFPPAGGGVQARVLIRQSSKEIWRKK